MEVNRGSVEVERALTVHHDRDPVAVVARIRFFVILLVKVQCVAEPTAASAGHPDTQHRAVVEFLLFDNTFSLHQQLFRSD